MSGRLVRAIMPDTAPLRISVDGAEVTAYAGESVLVAVLAARNELRRHEFSDEARAGFCLMGACQDCWIWLDDGRRIRACTTYAEPGMRIRTTWPDRLLAS
jgi:D-hydroxyproline dehydrogenase subunit gamma